MSIFKNLSIVILLVAFTAPSYTGAVMNESQSRKIGDSVRSTSESGSNSPKISSIDQILQKTQALIKNRGASSVDVVLTNLDRLINNTKDNTAKKVALTSLKQKIIAQRDAVDLTNISCIVPPYDYSIDHKTKEDGWEITYFKDPRLPIKDPRIFGNGDLETFKKEYDGKLAKLATLYEKLKPDALYQGFPYKKTFPIQVGSGVFFGVNVDYRSFENVDNQSFEEENRIEKIELQILKDTYSHGSINSDETIAAKFDSIMPHIRVTGDADHENIAYHRYYSSEGGTANILRAEVHLSAYRISFTEVYSNGNWIEFSSSYDTWSVSKDGKITRIPSSAESPFTAIQKRGEFVTGKIKTVDGLISGKQFGNGAYPWRVKQIEFFHPEGVLNYNSSDCKK